MRLCLDFRYTGRECGLETGEPCPCKVHSLGQYQALKSTISRCIIFWNRSFHFWWVRVPSDKINPLQWPEYPAILLHGSNNLRCLQASLPNWVASINASCLPASANPTTAIACILEQDLGTPWGIHQQWINNNIDTFSAFSMSLEETSCVKLLHSRTTRPKLMPGTTPTSPTRLVKWILLILLVRLPDPTILFQNGFLKNKR